ncbi:MAG: nucleotidyltransferase family protein [Acidaminococcaceae bacterium]|nr:nucleotidyltransferase family protein [Acidaminococcaceae bacterium]
MNTETLNQREAPDCRRLLTYNMVILAGGGGTVSLPGQGERARALAELKGRRLLDYIMEAVRQSRRIASVILVTHSAHFKAFRKAAVPGLLLCACDGSMAECAAAAIRKLRELPGHEGIAKVVTVCDDLPFLTGEALDDFIARAEAMHADAAYAIVRKEACLRDYPSLRRTFFHLKKGDFTGGNVSLVSVSLFPGCIDKMKEVFSLRKNPLKLAAWLGPSFIIKLLLRQLSLAEVEQKVSVLFGYRGRAVVTDYACIGTDLDKAEEWAEAEKYL